MEMIKELVTAIPAKYPGTTVKERKFHGVIVGYNFMLPNKMDLAISFDVFSYWNGRIPLFEYNGGETEMFERWCRSADDDEDYGDPELFVRFAYEVEMSIMDAHIFLADDIEKGWRSAEQIMETLRIAVEEPKKIAWFDYRLFQIGSRKRIEREEFDDEVWGYTLGNWRRIR